MFLFWFYFSHFHSPTPISWFSPLYPAFAPLFSTFLCPIPSILLILFSNSPFWLLEIAHHSEALFIITIFVFMARCSSFYIVTMWCIFHFHLHFHYDLSYNLMNTDTLFFYLFFWICSYFWIKNVNNFLIAEVLPQDVA